MNIHSAASGLATRECWQEQIKNFLVDGQGGVLSKAQICISEYAEDRNFQPPRGELPIKVVAIMHDIRKGKTSLSTFAKPT